MSRDGGHVPVDLRRPEQWGDVLAIDQDIARPAVGDGRRLDRDVARAQVGGDGRAVGGVDARPERQEGGGAVEQAVSKKSAPRRAARVSATVVLPAAAGPSIATTPRWSWLCRSDGLRACRRGGVARRSVRSVASIWTLLSGRVDPAVARAGVSRSDRPAGSLVGSPVATVRPGRVANGPRCGRRPRGRAGAAGPAAARPRSGPASGRRRYRLARRGAAGRAPPAPGRGATCLVAALALGRWAARCHECARHRPVVAGRWPWCAALGGSGPAPALRTNGRLGDAPIGALPPWPLIAPLLLVDRDAVGTNGRWSGASDMSRDRPGHGEPPPLDAARSAIVADLSRATVVSRGVPGPQWSRNPTLLRPRHAGGGGRRRPGCPVRRPRAEASARRDGGTGVATRGS
jgi:hypothetical protein